MAAQAIAQIIKNQLFRGAIGDVAGIGGAACGRLLVLDDGAGGEPQR